MVIRNLIEVAIRNRDKPTNNCAAGRGSDDLRGEAGLSARHHLIGDDQVLDVSFGSPQPGRAAFSSNGSSGGGEKVDRSVGDKQVEEFLSYLGLEKYTSLFQSHEIRFDTLVTMSESDLKGIGLKLFGPRRKISSAIRRWQEEQTCAAAGENHETEAALVEELQTTFEARVDDEVRYLTEKVGALSTSLTDAQIAQMKLEAELAIERQLRESAEQTIRGSTKE